MSKKKYLYHYSVRIFTPEGSMQFASGVYESKKKVTDSVTYNEVIRCISSINGWIMTSLVVTSFNRI